MRKILRHYRMNATAENLCMVDDLCRVTLKGQSLRDLERFLTDWTEVVNNLKIPQSDKTLEHLFHLQIRNFKALEVDVNYYERLPEGCGGEKSFEGLWLACSSTLSANGRRRTVIPERRR